MDSGSFEVVTKHYEESEHIEVDNFKFMELVVNAKVSTQDEFFKETDYPATVSLLACSGKYGYFVAGHNQGFVFGQTKHLRATFYATEEGSTSILEDKIIVPLDLPAHQIRLSWDEQTILVALSDGTVLSYYAEDVMEQKKDVQPKHSICFNIPIIDLRPNTGALPDSACVLLKDKQCRIANWKTGKTIANIPGLLVSAICWSPKGKRVICGTSDGTLEHYDLAGIKQSCIPLPESIQVGDADGNVKWTVQDVLWIDDGQILAIYTRSHGTEDDGSINAAYIIDQKPKSGTAPKYTRLAKLPLVIPSDRPYNHFYMEAIRDDTHTTIILANGASNLISVVGQDRTGNWAKWNLSQDGMASLPLSETDGYSTVPLGLTLDFAACEKLPPSDTSKSDVGVEPISILYCINDEGFIGAFHCYNQDLASTATKHQHMKATTPLASNPEPPSPTASTLSTNSNNSGTKSKSTLPFSSDPFDVAMKSGYSGKGFASLEKVKGATSPMLGSSSFGQLNTTTPIFGSTTSFGASSVTSSSNGSSPTSSPTKTTIGNSTVNSGTSATKDVSSSFPTFGLSGSIGSLELSGIGAVENSNSTNSSSDSTSSYEMINKNEITDNIPNPGAGGSFSIDQSKSASTKEVGHSELDSNVEGDDQVVPTDTTTKKETPESNTTILATNNKSDLKSAPVATTASSKKTFDFGSFILDKKVSDADANTVTSTSPKPKDDLPPTKAISPSANTFSFGLPTSFGGLAKKNVPVGTTPTSGDYTKTSTTSKTDTATPSGPSAFSFGDYAKKSGPAGTTPTFGGLTKMNTKLKTDTTTPSGSSAFIFGDLTKKQPPTGTPPTFDDVAKLYSNTKAAPSSIFGNLPNKHSDGSTTATPWSPWMTASSTITTTTSSSTTASSIQSTSVENQQQQQGAEPKEVLPEESKDPYSKIMEVVEKMSAMQAGFQQQLQSQSEQLDNLAKNVEHLTDSIKEWQSMKGDQVRAMPPMKIDRVKGQGSGVSKLDSGLTEAALIKQALATAGDSGKLECKDGGKIVAEMQYRIINKKGKKQDKREQEAGTSDYSFYDFRSAIQEMEQELKKKDEDMMELKQLLTLLRFREYQRKAEYSPSTIAFEDLTDDDDDGNNDTTGPQGQNDPKVPTTSGKPHHALAKSVDEDDSFDNSTDRTYQ